jgi:signal transduction histidine kinase
MASRPPPPLGARRVPTALDLYVCVVVLAGLLVCAVLFRDATTQIRGAGLTFWILAACVLPAELLRVTTWHRGVVNQLTMSRPFVVALLTGWGAPLAVMVFVVASVVSDLIYRKPAVRIPFNAAQYALSIAAAGAAYTSLGGTRSLTAAQIPAFLVAAVVLLLANRLLVRIAVALHEHHPISLGYLLAEAQVELMEGTIQFSMVLVALLVAKHRLVLPAVLALPALPIFVAGRAADRAEGLSRQYAEQLLRYRHLFVVADRFRRQADAKGGVSSTQLAAVALDLRTSTSMLKGLLGTIAGEADRRDLPLLRELAANGVEHAAVLASKLGQLERSGSQPQESPARQLADAGELVHMAELYAKTICQGRSVITEVQGENLPVLVNQDEILDVLSNLVLNAHRFAPPSTPVCLLASRAGTQVVLAVEDAGVDVSPEQREQVFEESLRFDQQLAASGIAQGLAMARQLAHANGGELRAIDGRQRAGRIRFELALPLSGEARHHDSATA